MRTHIVLWGPMDLLLFLLQFDAVFLTSLQENFSPVSATHTFSLYTSSPPSFLLISSTLFFVERAFMWFLRFPPKVLSVRYVGFLQLCFPAASSPNYPELSVELIMSQSLCFLFQHTTSTSHAVSMKQQLRDALSSAAENKFHSQAQRSLS